MKYDILQLNKPTQYAFMHYEYARNRGLSLSDYTCVYSGTIYEQDNESIEELLESMYILFNLNKPEKYKGHSLSVSDIIRFEDGRLFYVDTFGFKEINCDLLR